MTKQQLPHELDNTTEIERAVYLDNVAKLDEAWKEVDNERAKVNKLDIEIAHLKDEVAKQQQINQNLLKSFQELYTTYSQLYDQVITSNTALTITTGKLAESLVKYKFTIPQQEQPQP